MRTKFKFTFPVRCHSCGVACAVAMVLQFGALAGHAQTGDYLYSGSKVTITLKPGLYAITAYGGQGGSDFEGGPGGLGTEMEGKFNFTTTTTLTLLVGGAGGNGGNHQGAVGGGGGSGAAGSNAGNIGTSGGYGGFAGGVGGTNGGGGQGSGSAGGGGGYSGNGSGFGSIGGMSFLNGGGAGGGNGGGNGGFGGGASGGFPEAGGGGGGYSGGGAGGHSQFNTQFGFGGGGGGSIIDSSALLDLAEISGVASPDGSANGEIVITTVPEPTTLAMAGLVGLCLWLARRQWPCARRD